MMYRGSSIMYTGSVSYWIYLPGAETREQVCRSSTTRASGFLRISDDRSSDFFFLSVCLDDLQYGNSLHVCSVWRYVCSVWKYDVLSRVVLNTEDCWFLLSILSHI